MIGESKINNEAVLIAKWDGSRLNLDQGGLRVLKKFNQGQIHLLCLQNFAEKNYELLGKTRKQQAFPQNCMIIRTNPFYSRTQKHFFILQIKARDPAAREEFHVLAATICNVIVLAVDPRDNIAYLGAISRRVASQSNYRKDNQKGDRLSSLLCLLPVLGQKGEYLRQQTQKFLTKLQSDGALNQVISSHSLITGFECPEMTLLESNPNFQQKVMQEIERLSGNKSNSEVMFGPILVKFMENIETQMNQPSRVVDLQKSEDDISIDQGYQAYMAGVQTYHKVGLNLIDRNSKPDDNQLQQMLALAKNKAFDQFYSHDGSDNTQYRRMLQDYISQKNNEVVGTYSGQQWNKNLQILQSESKQVLDKISASKVKDPAVVMNYIDQMTRNYEQNAKGPQKYQILNDYMKVFTPVALEVDPEKQARLKQEMRKNQELLKRVEELKKQKSGCCSSCVIM